MNKSNSTSVLNCRSQKHLSPLYIKNVSIEELKEDPTVNVKLNSPRTLLAMCQTGITQEELTFYTFAEFLNKNKEVKLLPVDIQTSRYEFCEGLRKDRINQVAKCRDSIINKELSNSVTRNNLYNNNNNVYKSNLTTGYNNILSVSVSNDLKQLEQMKEKNKLELLNMLQLQVNNQLQLQANERKLLKQKEKQMYDNCKLSFLYPLNV